VPSPLVPTLSLCLLVALAPAAGAQTGAFSRFLGRGPAATDCMLVTDVAGATGRRAAACTDGDPACDADGVADGTCVFQVRLCLDAVGAGTPRCHTDVVTGAQVTSPLPTLAAALQAVVLPVTAPETCTAAAAVAVPTHGRRAARVVVRAQAGMASGHTDRDRVALVCRRRPGATATFATLQRRVFTASCATASCHGAGGAGGLTLTAGASYASLVGVPATNPVARDAGLLRVVPGDPDASFLLRKLQAALRPGEGAPMPFVGSALPPASIDLVRRWIAAGAPADAVF
jgi:hypothetical protein